MQFFKLILVIVGIGLLCGTTIDDDVQSVLDDRYQTELPEEKRECPPGFREIDCKDDYTGTGPCCEELFEGCDSDVEKPFDLPDPNLPTDVEFKNFGTYFLITMIVVLFLLLLVYLRGKVSVARSVDDQDVTSIVAELERKVGSTPHVEYAKLQKWDAAIHAMLLKAIVDLFLVQPELDRPATTGREIGFFAKPPFASDLKPMVEMVERILFAGHQATEDDYNKLLPHFEQMTTNIIAELGRE